MQSDEKWIELIIKWLKKETSETEHRMLFGWVYQNKRNESYFYQIKDLWETTGYSDIKNNVQTDTEWEKLMHAVINDKSVELQNKTQRLNKLKRIVQIAAVILITFSLGFFVDYLIPEKNSYSSISVPYGAKTKVELADGSFIWVNSGSTIKYPNNVTQKKVDIFLEGEAFFEIAKNSHRQLNVKTSTINIQVHGTRFNVKSYNEDNQVETTLVEGKISISGKVGNRVIENPIILKPNEQATLNGISNEITVKNDINDESEAGNSNKENPKPVAKAPVNVPHIKINEDVDVAEFIAWKDNKMVFKNETLENLVAKLERWYNVDIEIKREELKKSRYTGTFEKETLEQAMEALSISLPFNYTIYKNKIEITK